MLRQVSSRNHRAKGGFRAKNALQIWILVAVCVWLLYQIKHSHDHRKAYEERFGVDERQSENTGYGWKDLLPHTVETNSVIDTKGKEDAEDIELDDKVQGGDEDHRTDRGDKLRPEEADHKEHIDQVDRIGKKPGVFEDLEHEEQSHEDREKSFKGDDASSEVVHNNSQDVEHKEHTQEAREKSFKADDASSAVDHVVQVKETEIKDELLDSSKGTNSSVIHEPNDKVTIPGNVSEKTEPGAEHTTLEKLPTSSTTDKADDNMEEQTDLEIVDHMDNETEPQTYSMNELDSEIDLQVRSTDLSKDQINVQKNYTAVSEDWTETEKNQTKVVDPTIDVMSLQNQTTFPAPQDLNATAKSEIPSKEKSKTENAVRSEESEESSKASSVTGENKKDFPQESKDSLHSVNAKDRDFFLK